MLISLFSLAMTSKFQNNICFKVRAVALQLAIPVSCQWACSCSSQLSMYIVVAQLLASLSPTITPCFLVIEANHIPVHVSWI